MKNILLICAMMLTSVGLMAQSEYTGTVSVTVGGSFGPYTNDSVSYQLSWNADSTLNVTIGEYMLLGTVMGDLTLGEYTVSNLAYDEAKGGYYRDYTNDGLTMHFKAVSGGTATMDSDYTFEKNGGNLLVTPTADGYTIVNSFQPGSMPFPIVATANVSSSASALRTIAAPTTSSVCYDLQGRRVKDASGLHIEDGKLVIRR